MLPIYNSILEISASTLNLKTSISCNLFIFSRQESVRIWLVSLKHVLLIFNFSHQPQTFRRAVKKFFFYGLTLRPKFNSHISREINCIGTLNFCFFLSIYMQRCYNSKSLKQIEDYDFQKVAELTWNEPNANIYFLTYVA